MERTFTAVRKVFKVHESLAVTIRPDIARDLDVKAGDYVVMEPGDEDDCIRVYKWTGEHWRDRADYGGRDLKAEGGRSRPED